jgi:hypothetical protein
MAIALDTPPAESLEALRLAMSSLPPVEARVLDGLAKLPPEQAAAELPHRIETLSLEALLEGPGIVAAHPFGWRFLPTELPDAAIEVVATENGHEFALINRGPFVAGTKAAFARAEANSEVAGGEYRPTLLRVPALYVMALWLQASGGGGDLIFAIAPAPAELDVDRAYRLDDFQAALRELAQRLSSSRDPAGGPDLTVP